MDPFPPSCSRPPSGPLGRAPHGHGQHTCHMSPAALPISAAMAANIPATHRCLPTVARHPPGNMPATWLLEHGPSQSMAEATSPTPGSRAPRFSQLVRGPCVKCLFKRHTGAPPRRERGEGQWASKGQARAWAVEEGKCSLEGKGKERKRQGKKPLFYFFSKQNKAKPMAFPTLQP